MLSQRHKVLNMSTPMLTASATTSQSNVFRDELEDKFFRLKDEHQELKKEANNAEYQMKYLNAKLARLLNEKKRLMNKEKTRREIDLEELIFDLQQRLGQLDKENHRLRERTLLLRTQLDAEVGRRSTAYSHIRSRTDSGLASNLRHGLHTRSSSALVLNRRPITAESRVSTANVGANTHYLGHRSATLSVPSFALNLLEEAQEEIKKLEEVVAQQQTHIETLQLQTQRLKQLTNHNNSHHLENSLVNTSMTLKTTIDRTNITQSFNETNGFSQTTPHFNETSVKKHKQLVNHYSSGKKISDEISNLIEKLQTELSLERNKCSEMRKKLLEDKAQQNGHKEQKQRIETLEKENEILKKSLEQCIGSCITEINENRGESDANYGRQLEIQVSDLRTELSRLQKELHTERSKYQQLFAKHQSLETLYSKAKFQLQHMETKTSQNSGNECNRSDHLELSQQLEGMQTERQQLLQEFEDMKLILQSIEQSITSDE